jgi:hypothetical protein
MTMWKRKQSQSVPSWDDSRTEKEAGMDSAAIQGSGAVGAAQLNPTDRPARSARAAGPQKPSAASPAASLDAMPSSPPPEVLEQMAHAQRTFEQLAAQGHSVQFGHDSAGRAAVEVRDGDGRLVQSMSLAEAVDLAAGAAPQQR